MILADHSRSSLTLVLLALLGGTARSQGVRILEAPGLGLLPDIQTAVDAAADGDTLLVAPGAYGSFAVDDRSLWIVASEPGTVSIAGTVAVRNTTNKDVVVMVGIDATGLPQDVVADPGLLLDDNKGHLRFQQCTFTGGAGTEKGPDPDQYGDGGPGARAYDNKRVVFAGCTFRGGDGGEKSNSLNYNSIGGRAGSGVHAELSTVVLYDSTATGGEGGRGGWKGGDGGDGCLVSDFGIVAAGCTFAGGDGGFAWDSFACKGGDGGDALHVEAAGQAQLVDNQYLRGVQGTACCGQPSGKPGVQLGGAGVFNTHPVSARSFQAAHIASDGVLWKVAATVDPGDVAFFFGATEPEFMVPSPILGIWLTPLPSTRLAYPYPATTFGNQQGPPNVSPVLENLKAGKSHLPMYWQGAVVESGQLQPCSPVHVLVFDRAGLPDCDADGVNDYVALSEGLETDCNANLIPDACDIASATDPDCNGNGLPDSCDIATGTSPDLNGNGIPDECEGVGVVWHVDDDAPPGGNGSVASPFQAIGDAVALALTGDIVLVQDGSYTGVGNREMDFAGRDLAVVGANGPAACIIDLQQLGRAFQLTSGETEAARIEGLTIRNGNAASSPTSLGLGGGVVVRSAGVTLANCVFDSCTATRGGALFASSGGSTRVTGCTFSNNQALSIGGAIYGYDQPRFIDQSRFLDNFASTSGGAVRVWGNPGDPVNIAHCEFTGNQAQSAGAVDFSSFANPQSGISESLFAGNTAGFQGGAILIRGQDSVLSGLTIVDNSSGLMGGGLVVNDEEVGLADSILWGNSAPSGAQAAVAPSLGADAGVLTVDFCCLQGGSGAVYVAPGHTLQWGAGNLQGDPLFSDPDGPDNVPSTFGDNDYRLGPGSPCVDAGDVAAVAPDLLDLDGDGDTTEPVPFDLDLLPRFQDDPAVPDTGNGPAPVVDMGAYEKQD